MGINDEGIVFPQEQEQQEQEQQEQEQQHQHANEELSPRILWGINYAEDYLKYSARCHEVINQLVVTSYLS